jgi:cell division protein FtsL
VTPSAMTSAGRVSERTRPAPRGTRPARRAPMTRPPRRVSGPSGGRHRHAVTRGRAAAAPRQGATLGVRAVAVVRSLPDRALIDRLVRGRAWIPVLGMLLAGIVAMQVEILKLGTTTGRALQRSTALQTQNESLQASVAALGDDQRIERLAAGMGMVMPSPSNVVFLSGRSGAAPGRAIANIHAPDPVGFSAQLAAQTAAAAALAPAATTTAAPAGATSTATAGVAGSTTGTAPTAAGTSLTAAGTSPTASGTTGAALGAVQPQPVATGPSGAPAAAGVTPAQPAVAPATTSSGSGAAGQGPATGAAGVAPPASPQSGSPAGG